MQFPSVYCAFSLNFLFVCAILIEFHLDYLNQLIARVLRLKLFLIEPIQIQIFFIGLPLRVISFKIDFFFQFTDALVLSDLAVVIKSLIFKVAGPSCLGALFQIGVFDYCVVSVVKKLVFIIHLVYYRN